MMPYTIKEQNNGSYLFLSAEPFVFKNGKTIDDLALVYEIYGQWNAEKNNVILVHHALSTNSHVASHEKNKTKGWWEAIVGPNKSIDTNRYCVICINNLGSCFGSSGPASFNSTTGKKYGLTFPEVTMEDMVNAQQYLLQCLAITELYAIVGPSMGAMLSLTFALHYPQQVKRLMMISSCYRAYPMNKAIRAIKRDAICLDPLWNNGNYKQNPLPGFTLARKIGYLSYRNANDLNQRFVGEIEGERQGIISYLQYNAEKFTTQFDVNSYLYLMRAMDLFDVTQNDIRAGEIFLRLQAISWIVAVSSDALFQVEQQKDLYHAIQSAGKKVHYILHDSPAGHDAFLIETDAFGAYIQNVLNDECHDK